MLHVSTETKDKEHALPSREEASIWRKVHASQPPLQIPFEGPRLNVSMHGALEKEERLPQPFVDVMSSEAALCLFPLPFSVSLCLSSFGFLFWHYDKKMKEECESTSQNLHSMET